ncbi:MFS transporter [Xanthomonas theicola]|nr:MFS transporter [Xanthomonas theicola]
MQQRSEPQTGGSDRPSASTTAGSPAAKRMAPLMTLLFAVAVAVAIIVMNLYAAQPMLAAIAASLHEPGAAIGLIAMLPLLGSTCGQFLLVPLADLLENRGLIVRLLWGCALCLGVAMLSAQAWLFLTAIFLAGALSSAIQMLVPMAAFMSDEAARGRIIGNVMSALMLGIMLSRPIAGALASSTGWRAVYGLLAPTVGLLAPVLARVLPERRPHSPQRYGQILRSLWQLLRHERVLQCGALTGALGMAIYMAYWTTIALLLTSPPFSLHAGAVAAFALMGATAVCVTPLAGRAGDRGHGRIASRGSHLAMLAAALVAGMAGAGWGRWIGIDLHGHATVALLAAILLDGGMAADQTLINLMPPHLRGRLNGLFVGLLFIGGALGAAASRDGHGNWAAGRRSACCNWASTWRSCWWAHTDSATEPGHRQWRSPSKETPVAQRRDRRGTAPIAQGLRTAADHRRRRHRGPFAEWRRRLAPPRPTPDRRARPGRRTTMAHACPAARSNTRRRKRPRSREAFPITAAATTQPRCAAVAAVAAYFTSAAIAAPRSPGERTVLTPAASIAANLPSAVPEPPEAIAPAWPMRLPFGAEAPAMKPTTGFSTCCLMYSAAASSAAPPISPTMMMPSVCGSSLNSLRQSTKFRPLIGSPPMPITVDWPRPAAVVCLTAS